MMRAIPEFLHSEPATIEPGPSELGGDTVVLLKRDLKLGDAEIAGLRERGIIPPEHARPPVEEPTFA